MRFKIAKVNIDGVELLPDIVDTPLWPLIDPDRAAPTERTVQICGLYSAIKQRENWYQENTPTAYGDPMYSFYNGKVMGFLEAMGAEEEQQDGCIIIRRKNRVVLEVEKPSRTAAYYEAKRDIQETMSALGL